MIPKVSVIITIYNREKYIEDCARSLFEQTLDDVEFLFVDDASTDNSVMILRNLLEDYPKKKAMTKIICLKNNGGRAFARQTGIDNVTGEYYVIVYSYCLSLNGDLIRHVCEYLRFRISSYSWLGLPVLANK